MVIDEHTGLVSLEINLFPGFYTFNLQAEAVGTSSIATAPVRHKLQFNYYCVIIILAYHNILRSLYISSLNMKNFVNPVHTNLSCEQFKII